MIKVHQHPLVCRCNDCQTMFPNDRFEPTWTYPAPEGIEAVRMTARLPLGNPNANAAFFVWVDNDNRLASDWPGFPGTAGARVEVDRQSLTVLSTKDPVLAALADPIPLRRKSIERINLRCMVDYGLAPDEAADFVSCELHGFGIPALACEHVLSSPESLEVVVLYGVDGDYPDCLCPTCYERFLQRDMSHLYTVCSHCQQAHIYRHHILGTTWYGADKPFELPAGKRNSPFVVRSKDQASGAKSCGTGSDGHKGCC